MNSRVAAGGVLAGAAWLLLASGCNDSDIGHVNTVSKISVRVSVERFADEVEEGGDAAEISADGRYVVFHSEAPDLAPGDYNGLQDVFLKDRVTGEVDNVSIVFPRVVNSPAPADSSDPAVSDDGRYVAFLSEGDLGGSYFPIDVHAGLPNVWVFDRVTRLVRPATVGAGNGWPDAPCSDVTISGDGRWVVFSSAAGNLGYGAGGNSQVYASDWQSMGTPLVLVSHVAGNSNAAGDGESTEPRIAGDGLFVAFTSTATNLESGGIDGDAVRDVYLGRTDGGDTELVSITSDGFFNGGAFGEPSFFPSVSSDGRFVVFNTTAFVLPDGASLSGTGVLLRDRALITNVLVANDIVPVMTVPPTGFPCDVSDDGDLVVYKSFSGAGLSLNVGQIFARRLSGGVDLISTSLQEGVAGNQEGFNPRIARDGSWCVFSSQADDIVVGDTNGALDIFVRGPLR